MKSRIIAALRCLAGKPTVYGVLLGETLGGSESAGPQKGLRFIDCFNEYEVLHSEGNKHA